MNGRERGRNPIMYINEYFMIFSLVKIGSSTIYIQTYKIINI